MRRHLHGLGVVSVCLVLLSLFLVLPTKADLTWRIQIVDLAGGSYTSLSLDFSGNPHISYLAHGTLKYAAIGKSGGWNKQTIDSVGYFDSATSLALDSSGNPHISYYANGDLKYASGNPAPTPTPTRTPTPTPTSTETLTADLSESASALNFGNTINFTVTVEGGTAPFTFAWYIDNQLSETGNSPYYSTSTQPVGPHHIYVQVTDADGNTAQTLSPEFNVLPTTIPSNSPSRTEQPTQQPTPTPDSNQAGEFTTAIILGVVVVVAVAVAALVYFRRREP